MIRLSSLLLLLLLTPVLCFAGDTEVKGLIKSLTAVNSHDRTNIMGAVGDESAMVEQNFTGRIMVKSELVENIKIDVHYENSFSKGESFSAINALQGKTSNISMIERKSPIDSAQFFSLTKEYVNENDEQAYHRLDRLYLEYSDFDYTVRVGRQALTWGGGKIFNPIDIMNPFAPTDVVRDYKNGSDMITVQAYSDYISDVQVAIVPRRDIKTRELEYDESSAALKLQNTFGETDAEILFGSHYGDNFLGGGVAGPFKDAVWRTNVILSDGDSKKYFSAVANIDYSWLTKGNNTYGYIEFYYNNMGVDSAEALADNTELMERLERGDFFMRDNYYMAAGLQYDPHPLVTIFLSGIYNTDDSSYIAQPRVEWDIKSDVKILVGADIPEGNLGSEFGGFTDSSTGRVISPAKRLYGQVTYYF